MTARSREDELREVPLWKANKERWPPGVREIAMEEQDCLGIDRRGNLYWDGRHLALRYRHFSLPQSSSASRFTAWRCRPPAPVVREKSQFVLKVDSLSLSPRL
jgi:hypothetical protein